MNIYLTAADMAVLKQKNTRLKVLHKRFETGVNKFYTRGTTQIADKELRRLFEVDQPLCTHVAYTEHPMRQNGFQVNSSEGRGHSFYIPTYTDRRLSEMRDHCDHSSS